ERWSHYPEKVADEIRNLKSAIGRREHSLTCAYARVLLMSTAFLGGVLGLPMRSIFGEVQRSNLAKLVDRKVLRHPDGKVAKPEGWTAPDIAGVLALHGYKAAA